MQSKKHRLDLLNTHILQSDLTAIKSHVHSEWDYDRSLSKLDTKEATEVFCMSKFPEEDKILDIIKENQLFEYDYLPTNIA
jgi:hypothetical protein